MNWYDIPIKRPVATVMLFSAIILLGIVGWQKIPVDLAPPGMSDDRLYVRFDRPNSEPEVVEREILIPLEAKASELMGMKETWGDINGSGGLFTVSFESGTDMKVRQLELQRLAIELKKNQPDRTIINVDAQNSTIFSRFVMEIRVLGDTDENALRSLAEDRVQKRIEAVTGVDSVMVMGGAPEEVTVMVNTDKSAALGISPQNVTESLIRSVRRLRFLGGLEDASNRIPVMLDGRPGGIHTLNESRVVPNKPVLIRHVADVSAGIGEKNELYRVNGKSSVGLYVFKEESANLVEVSRGLRSRIEDLREEFRQYGIDFVIGFNGAKIIETQLGSLKKRALSGFIIALVVLFLFIRRLRAVAVVAVAVPVSLLAAFAMLYTSGYTLNILTLFGLAVGVGMLVDNSIVVFESIQRRLERGVDPDTAAGEGVKITVRAIIAATATTAVVFLPALFLIENAMIRSLIKNLAVTILFPLMASLIVAVGLVPLLSRKLAAPAALARLNANRKRRELYAGLTYPDKWRELFSGLLKTSLRRPAAWLAVITVAILITLFVAASWLIVSGTAKEAREADEIRLSIDVPSGDSLEAIGRNMSALEQAALDLEGVESVTSNVREDNSVLNIKLVDKDERPKEINASRVREKVREAAKTLKGISIRSESSMGGSGSGDRGGSGGLPGQAPSEIVISGPDTGQLTNLAQLVKERLESIPEIGSHNVRLSVKVDQDEIHVIPDYSMLESLGLTSDQVLPMIRLLRRDGNVMPIGINMSNGREIPLIIRTNKTVSGSLNNRIEQFKIPTSAGVIPLGLVSDTRKMPPPPMIQHHNGRRELSVFYSFTASAPETGPSRDALDEKILSMIRSIHLPAGYIIDPPDEEESTSWLKRLGIPMVLLLFAVLAITFESLTMPVVVLLAAPLAVLGSVWALVLAGMRIDYYAGAGFIVLLGLTVNPAILLVDRMQQKVLNSSWSAGAAAMAAVRERSRPVLMATCTTIAGLWPLSMSTGSEFEVWPPFAVSIMGGLVTSSLLILLVIPMGFVFLSRLDRIFGRLGAWFVLSWMGMTALVMTPLIIYEKITSMTWQVTTTVLVAAMFLGVLVLLFRRQEIPEPSPEVSVDVKFLHKIYGRPGPVGRAWRSGEHFAEKVLSRGGVPFLKSDTLQPIITMSVLLIGSIYLAVFLDSTWWRLVFSYTGAIILSMLIIQFRRLRGKCDILGKPLPGGVEHFLAFFVPWIVFVLIGFHYYYVPVMADKNPMLTPLSLVLIAAVIIFIQKGRKTAKDLSTGKTHDRVDIGFFHRLKILWRKISRVLFSFDLPREEVDALKNIHFRADHGMIGILGPNGAGKTTLLRTLAGILDPTTGAIELGGVPLKKIRRHLAKWIGYLPQDFGLPNNLTGREYLKYYALLYNIDENNELHERVDFLLNETGLSEQADKRIGDYSGGMRQRVAVARTLLRLPPVIIVDEPTVGLDPRERIRFRNLLAKLSKTRIVLFSTHVVEDVAVACDRVIVLSGGRKVFDDKPYLLANEAEGKVWELKIKEGEENDLPQDAIVVDQIPEEGFYNIRVLCSKIPSPEAKAISPDLQDGYLQLVGKRMSRSATI